MKKCKHGNTGDCERCNYDRVLLLEDSKSLFHCECGHDVFRSPEPGVYVCKACQAQYRGEP